MGEIVNILLLFFGFIFTFFIPGFIVIEVFYSEIEKIEKIPLILLLSVLLSTYLVFFVSLVFGYSAETILFTSLPFFIWTFFLIYQKRKNTFKIIETIKDHQWGIILSLILSGLFLIALFPAIFVKHGNYFVMSASNWQDTAMHQSFIESFSQGNFPPEAPYFSGHPLTYYYFVDFHSSILETLYGNFFPRVLVYDNPLFVFTFTISIYCLSLLIFKRKKAAILALILACFFGNFMFFILGSDVLNDKSSLSLWNSLINHLTNKGYTAEFGKLMDVTPMADYFLQNRPMMVGLPAFVLVNLLIIKSLEESDKQSFFVSKKRIFLAGIITGMLIKFQLFAFFCSGLIFILGLVIYYHKDIKKNLNYLLIFAAPVLFFISFFSLFFQTGQSLLSEGIQNFRLGLWDKTKDLWWYLAFYLTNFGLPFAIVILMAITYFLHILKTHKVNNQINFLFAEFFILLAIPHLIAFTVYPFDMFKFFYFMVVPMSILAGLGLLTISGYKIIGPVLVFLILTVSSLNSLTTLVWSYLNKYQGYTESEYLSGLWIRSHTAQKSIFVTHPSVHSPVSEIGGRIRVLSYTVWPYSHGFNQGEDNVFTRQADIENLYKNPNQVEVVESFKNKYKVNYLYLGNEESNSYGITRSVFLKNPNLQLVFESPDIQIFKLK